MDSSLHRICKHCTAIFEHAARLLTSESDDGNISDDVATALTAEHHSLLVANINAKSCHMCSLISHIFPRVLDPFDPKGTPQWLMWGDKDEQYLDLGFHISKHDFIQDLRIQTREDLPLYKKQLAKLTGYRQRSGCEPAQYVVHLVIRCSQDCSNLDAGLHVNRKQNSYTMRTATSKEAAASAACRCHVASARPHQRCSRNDTR